MRAVAFHPDGKHLATAGVDRTVVLWELSTERVVRTFTGHTDEVNDIAFRHDGHQLASASADQTVAVWCLLPGQEFRPLFAVLSPPPLASSLVNALAAVTGPSLILRGHTHRVRTVAFSPDDQWIASGGVDQTVKIWNANTGQELHTLRGHRDDVTCVSFSPDGQQLASASWDRTVKLWNVATGQEVLTFRRHTGRVASVAFSSDRERLVSGDDDGIVWVWDIRRGDQASLAPLTFVNGHSEDITCVRVSWDGRYLVTAGRRGGSVRLRDPTTGALIQTIPIASMPIQLSLDNAGQLLATIDDAAMVRVWFVGQPPPTK
jgi:WD40 repeat protein